MSAVQSREARLVHTAKHADSDWTGHSCSRRSAHRACRSSTAGGAQRSARPYARGWRSKVDGRPYELCPSVGMADVGAVGGAVDD
jgi:hypothetical protein